MSKYVYLSIEGLHRGCPKINYQKKRRMSKDVYLSIEGLQSQFVGSLFYWRSLDVS